MAAKHRQGSFTNSYLVSLFLTLSISAPTELSAATGEFAQNLGELASSDVGKQLSRSLTGLADVQRIAQDLQNVQSDQDMGTLMATADEYSRLINSVRVSWLPIHALSLLSFFFSLRSLPSIPAFECIIHGSPLKVTCCGRNKPTKRTALKDGYLLNDWDTP